MNEDRSAVTVMTSSRIFRFGDRLLDRLWEAGRSSRFMQLAASIVETIQGSPRDLVLLGSGVLILTAVTVHLLLMLALGPTDSWWWLVIPGIAAAGGAVVLLWSRARR